MAKLSEAGRVERGNEETALMFFQRVVSKMPDPRRAQGRRYPLAAVVVTALMGMVCGADNAEELEAWGEAREDWLREIVDLPHGAPTQDVFLYVFSLLDPAAFRSVFLQWVELLRRTLSTIGKHIAIDGKTSRRSADKAHDRPAIHTVSAWLCDEGLVLGQLKTDDKSNEITAIPELLRVLTITGATVSLDAMGCQTEIAKAVADKGGHYILSVKENQPTLHADAVETFGEADDDRRRTVEETKRPSVDTYEEVDKGHGRIEKRTVQITRDLDWMSTKDNWAGLSAVIRVIRERTVVASGKTSTEVAWYISNHPGLSAESASHDVRQHWAIENSLHWVLDTAFGEDLCRHRARHLAENFTALRHFALNLLKSDPGRRIGIAGSRKRAGWDMDYLLRIVTGKTSGTDATSRKRGRTSRDRSRPATH